MRQAANATSDLRRRRRKSGIGYGAQVRPLGTTSYNRWDRYLTANLTYLFARIRLNLLHLRHAPSCRLLCGAAAECATARAADVVGWGRQQTAGAAAMSLVKRSPATRGKFPFKYPAASPIMAAPLSRRCRIRRGRWIGVLCC